LRIVITSARPAAVFDADRRLGLPERVRVVHRGFFDPLPVD
jgi:hypothetical protein